MYAAYDSLAAPVKEMIDGLTAVHDICGGGPYGRVPNYREIVLAQPDGLHRLHTIENDFPPVSHPVVRTHPETGRRALFVNRSFTTRIEGVSKLESAWLLGMLLEHAEQVAFQMRHRWRMNDLVMWDNRCAQSCSCRLRPGPPPHASHYRPGRPPSLSDRGWPRSLERVPPPPGLSLHSV